MAEQLQRLRLQEAQLGALSDSAHERGDLDAWALIERARFHLDDAIAALVSIAS